MSPEAAGKPASYVRVLICLLVTSLLCQPENILAAQKYRTVAYKPTLKIDLHRYGYARVASERDKLAFDFLDHTVAFLDGGTLAVSFFAHNSDAIGLSTREGHSGSLFVFRTVFIDIKSGEPRAQRSWANAGYYNSFVPLEDGKFLVQSLESVTIYSSKIEQISRRDFKVEGDVLPRFEASPSGHTLYKLQDAWSTKAEQWVTRIDALNQTSLEPIGSAFIFSQTQTKESLSDGQIAYWYEPAPHFPANYADSHLNNLVIKNIAVLKKPVSFPNPESVEAKRLADYKCSAATFITNDVVALSGCSHLFLIRAEGEVFANIDFGKQRVGPVFATARQGGRFAFTVARMEGPSNVRNIDLNVYDLSGRKIVFRLTVEPLPQHKFWFALSPDGTLLAMQNDETICVWTIP